MENIENWNLVRIGKKGLKDLPSLLLIRKFINLCQQTHEHS